MDIHDLGFTGDAGMSPEDPGNSFTIGRVTQEHRERYVVSTGEKEYEAEITGNLRFSATGRAGFPAVGDWVAMAVYDDNYALIHRILPRKTILERQAVGKSGEKQIIASNADFAFIVQSIDNNFNINRLERYLTICHSAGIEPVLVLSKTDLIDEAGLQDILNSLGARERKVKYLLLSNTTLAGLDTIASFMEKGRTYCVIGSSGVGKSSLINNLLQRNILKTREISLSTGKGKHATEHRELFILENGAIVIDTPGMRELGVTEDETGAMATFSEIHELSLMCKFPDCRHIDEKGCAVLEALGKGEIDKDSLENYRKILKEQERFGSSVAERRKKDKDFGKMVKKVLEEKKRHKF